MKPTIACVIPAYNRQDTIGEAIESVLKQSRQPDEIIIVDDGSTDDTQEVCQRYTANIRVISQENGGASSARNRGAKEANSEWIAWLDSDDVWTETYLSTVEEAIVETSGKAQLYFSNIELDREQFKNNRIWDHLSIDFDGALYCVFDDPPKFALKHHFMAMLQTSVMNKEAFDKLGGFDETLSVHEDLHMFLMFFLSFSVCAVNQVGGLMGAGQCNRLSNSNLLRKLRDSQRMWESLRQRYPDLSREWVKKCYNYESKALKRQSKYHILNGGFISGLNVIMKSLCKKYKALIA